MKRYLYLPLMLASILVLFLGGNQLLGMALTGARLDLTQNGLYRLSPGSDEIIDRINEPIEWRFYHSRAETAQYPAIRAYATRVREFLRVYAQTSNGRIHLTEIDPQPFSSNEDDALAAGLIPLPTQGGERLFFGLVASNSIDELEVIPLFSEEDESRLEYDLTRLIADLERSGRPRLAILTSLPLSPDSGAPNNFTAELNAAFELIWLAPDFDTIPDSAALLIMHPGVLTQGQYYLIDQYALSQKRIVAFLDPMAHMALRPAADGLPRIDAQRASDLGPLMANWGVDWDKNTVAMDRLLGLPVEIVDTDGRSRRRAYPLWFSVGTQQMSATDLSTTALDRGINFGSPGALVPLPDSDLDFQPLLTTSEDGSLTDGDVAASAPGPDDLLRGYQPVSAPVVLAARISGLAQTAFPEGPPAGDILFRAADHVSVSDAPVDIAVVADADWLDDAYYVRTDPALGDSVVADNLSVAMNLIDMAVGDPALIGLRSRAPSYRPMTRVDALRADAESRYVDIQDRLEAEIADAETRLQALQATGEASRLFSNTSDIGRGEARQLRQQITDTRARLREVEREFRQEIDSLDASLQFWAIGVPPALVIVLGLLGTIVRRRRAAS
jgi:ABC-2 type transport system permease protein